MGRYSNCTHALKKHTHFKRCQRSGGSQPKKKKGISRRLQDMPGKNNCWRSEAEFAVALVGRSCCMGGGLVEWFSSQSWCLGARPRSFFLATARASESQWDRPSGIIITGQPPVVALTPWCRKCDYRANGIMGSIGPGGTIYA